MKVYVNCQGHMTKMAAMAINSKNFKKIFLSRTRRPMFLKLGMKHQGEELYKVYINHNPGMTLANFMARSAEDAYPRSQVSVYRTIDPLVLIYVFCGHLDNMTKMSRTNFQCNHPKRLHIKFQLDRPSGFREKDL